MKFHVLIREVHIRKKEVEADSAEEAVAKVKAGDGDEISCEYSHTLDWEAWTVESGLK